MSAVLHIPPDDNPVAAQLTSFNFAFNSGKGNFAVADCNCSVAVRGSQGTLQKGQLQPISDSALEASAVINFPSIGIYDVIVTGTSKSHAFQSFKLDFVERVASSAQSPKSANNGAAQTIMSISIASLILLVMVAYAAISRGGRYQK